MSRDSAREHRFSVSGPDGAEVFDLLVAVPKIGPVKAPHLLAVARISPAKTVAVLSERQRARLIELLSR